MRSQTYDEVLGLGDVGLTVAIAEEIEGKTAWREESGLPYIVHGKHPIIVFTPLGLHAKGDYLSVGFYWSNMDRAWSLVEKLKTVIDPTHDVEGDSPLLDHVANCIEDILGFNWGTGTATLFYAELLFQLTPKALAQACLMGYRMWKDDVKNCREYAGKGN